MNRYHAVISTGDHPGHKRVTVEAESSAKAAEILAGQYGNMAIVELWRDQLEQKEDFYRNPAG